MKINIEDGSIITFYGITWNDGWEFDAPSIITSPGYFYSDSYGGLDELVEETCITLSVDGFIESDEEVFESEWRGWKAEQFDKFIKDSFENKKTKLPDYFKELRKEIEEVLIMKTTVKFVWNEKEEYFDTEDLHYEEKWIKL